jgi:biotin synthase-related radical SAM superfamily protein
MRSSNLDIKSRLIEEGKIFIPREITMPCFASRSTAGPDAGVASFAFGFSSSRIKLEVVKDPEARYHLRQNGTDFSIMEDDSEFIGGVKVLPTLAHSPNQAFINLSSKCIYGCLFCSAPSMDRDEIEMSSERVMRIVGIASNYPDFEAISITSGVPDSATSTNHRVAEITRALKENYPEYPLGVEVYFDNPSELGLLKDSGADEIKINIEVWPEELFKTICPNRDRELILKTLERAVKIFGRGKVTSNVLVGLGETDSDVEEGLDALAGMDVVANIRAVRINKYNKERLGKGLGEVPEAVKAERLLALAKVHKQILESHGLTTKTFSTMCFSCNCCDIVPMVDL